MINKKRYALLISLILGSNAFAQIGLPSRPDITIASDHPFFDASSYTNDVPNSQNKGLYFPSTDLTQWEFKTNNLDGVTFPTAFNGMVVYNTATGSTQSDISKSGQIVTVKPGFYYFFNPNNADGTSVANGYWKPFEGGEIPGQPWYDATTQTQATDNTQNIYQMGRVGVYTQNPKATLQIEASGLADQPDGVLIPRILHSDLQAKSETAYDLAQNATLIYIIDDLLSGSGPGARVASSKTENVAGSGFYYYDAKAFRWKAIETKVANGLTLNHYNVITLGGQLSQDTNITGTKTLTLETSTTISGNLKVTSGSPGTGKVLTSNATGGATWADIPKDQWKLNGNELTSTDFLGSTNNVDLVFKRNNANVGILGLYNVAFGYQALLNNQPTGGYNVALGHSSLKDNTTGDNNIALGQSSLEKNTIGFDNIAIGNKAMSSAIEGYRNIAIGKGTLEQTNGDDNVAIGNNALNKNTNAYRNVAIGLNALSSNTTGNYNVAIGYEALHNNIIGSTNVAIGPGALRNNVNGARNTAIGESSLPSLETGSENIAIGDAALGGLISGEKNIGIGNYAINQMKYGNSNVAIGNETYMPDNLIGATAIGYGARATSSYSLILGGKAPGNIESTKVGIGTTAPVATLHIVADYTDIARADGLIIPRFAKSDLSRRDNAYSAEHDGILVFITDSTGAGTPKTANISKRGVYYYDATTNTWEHI